MLAAHALHSLLKLELKCLCGVTGSFELLLHFLELLNKVLKVFQSVLLFARLELRMIFAEQSLQELGPYSILIVFIFCIWLIRPFFSKFLLRIFA